MGEVWRARDPRLERDVALKVLPATAEADESARKRLLREARMASKLNHPHVCTIYEVGEAEGQAFIAMELVEGESLAARLSTGPLPPEQVLRYGEQVAEALEHAHSRGVVHRDLKCANVVITPEGQPRCWTSAWRVGSGAKPMVKLPLSQWSRPSCRARSPAPCPTWHLNSCEASRRIPARTCGP
jgi:serine/threonine protein kinase